MEKPLISEWLLFRGDELNITTKLERINPVCSEVIDWTW